jgi:uncharacterized membrane-anchored protein YhcB (DUF1043 family)
METKGDDLLYDEQMYKRLCEIYPQYESEERAPESRQRAKKDYCPGSGVEKSETDWTKIRIEIK